MAMLPGRFAFKEDGPYDGVRIEIFIEKEEREEKLDRYKVMTYKKTLQWPPGQKYQIEIREKTNKSQLGPTRNDWVIA